MDELNPTEEFEGLESADPVFWLRLRPDR
jgi:hypothetical protein